MKAIAPGTVIFHHHRGYGVLTAVNLMTGWVSARFGSEKRIIDLNLSSDDIQHADGERILFRHTPPDFLPHARLMALIRVLHDAGYQRLYLHTCPRPSGMHWRWHIFTGTRNWIHRPWREGWYGSSSDYIFNPIFGWGDAPGASTEELVHALATYDPPFLAEALGEDEEHAVWFKYVCDTLLPDYMYSLELNGRNPLAPGPLPVYPVRPNVPDYAGKDLPWPPGWSRHWRFANSPIKRRQF